MNVTSDVHLSLLSFPDNPSSGYPYKGRLSISYICSVLTVFCYVKYSEHIGEPLAGLVKNKSSSRCQRGQGHAVSQNPF
jgi:hypothetical protein